MMQMITGISNPRITLVLTNAELGKLIEEMKKPELDGRAGIEKVIETLSKICKSAEQETKKLET